MVTFPHILGRKTSGLIVHKVVTTSVVTVPKILGRKTSGLIVTQIRWPQQSWLFPIFLPQNKRAYCYTNQVATTIVVTGPHILGRKTSELIVTKIKWSHQTDLLLFNYVAEKQAGLLLHELPDSNKRT